MKLWRLVKMTVGEKDIDVEKNSKIKILLPALGVALPISTLIRSRLEGNWQGQAEDFIFILAAGV